MRKNFYFILSVLIVAANIFVPACGSKSSNNSPVLPYGSPGYGTSCLPGQICTNQQGVGGGVPLLPGPATATNFDSFGSVLQLNFLGQQVTIGQAGYSGPVVIQGVLNIGQGSICPSPGQYTVQGQGTYQSSGMGCASDGCVSGQLQLQGPYGSGTAQLDPSSIHIVNNGAILGMQLEIPSCGRVISTPYN